MNCLEEALGCLRIATWNILADAYAGPKRYEYVEPESLLSWRGHRLGRIGSILKSIFADVVLLQEVDHPEDLTVLLHEMGYDVHFEKRNGGRQDGCMTAWRREKLELVGHAVRVQFDDLVAVAKDDSIIGGGARHLRHNVGAITVFKQIQTGSSKLATRVHPFIIVANAHLYWSPVCEDVKLLQARHLLRACDLVEARLKKSLGKQYLNAAILSDATPVTIPRFLCGDFNSKPDSVVTKHLLRGILPTPKKTSGFALDDNLYQLTRWLRMLGIDCVVFSLQGMLRSQDARSREKLFSSWIEEGRAMITVSKQLTVRRGAPTSLVVENSRNSSLENEFKRLVRRFGSSLFTENHKFYGRCVKCNAPILPISRDQIPPESVGKGKNVPLFVFESEEPLFMCGKQASISVNARARESSNDGGRLVNEMLPERRSGVRANGGILKYTKAETLNERHASGTREGCGQVYWWGKGADGTTTTVNRAINLVERLQELVRQVDSIADEKDSNTSKSLATSLRAHQNTPVALAAQNFIRAQQQNLQGENNPQNTPKEAFISLGDYCDELHQRSRLFLALHGTLSNQCSRNTFGPPERCFKSSVSADKNNMSMSMEAAQQIYDAVAKNISTYGALAESMKPPMFASAYDVSDPLHVTNKTSTFVDILDYIYYNSSAGVNLVRTHPVASTLHLSEKAYAGAKASKETPEEGISIPNLPCSHWPSDHLLLCADFETFLLSSQ